MHLILVLGKRKVSYVNTALYMQKHPCIFRASQTSCGVSLQLQGPCFKGNISNSLPYPKDGGRGSCPVERVEEVGDLEQNLVRRVRDWGYHTEEGFYVF